MNTYATTTRDTTFNAVSRVQSTILNKTPGMYVYRALYQQLHHVHPFLPLQLLTILILDEETEAGMGALGLLQTVGNTINRIGLCIKSIT